MLSRLGRFLYIITFSSFGPGKVLMRWINGGWIALSFLAGYELKNRQVSVGISESHFTVSLGLIVVILMVSFFLALRAGPAWIESGLADLRFGSVHYDSKSSSFWLEIQNHGYVDSEVVKIWVANAVNSDGSEANKLFLPILLDTFTHGVIARGHSTVKLGKISLIDNFSPCLSLSGLGPNDQHRTADFTLSGFEWADNANRIYINVSINHASRRLDGWCELQSLSSASPHMVISLVRKPLRERQITRQRAKLGIEPSLQSPKSTKHENSD